MNMVIHRGDDGKVDRIEYTPSRARMAVYSLGCGFGVLFFILGCVRDVGHFFGADSGHWLAMAIDLATFPLFFSLTKHYLLRARLYARLLRKGPKFILGKHSLEYEVRGKNSFAYPWDDLLKTPEYTLVFKPDKEVPLPPEFWKWHSNHEYFKELLDETMLSRFTYSEYGFEGLSLYDNETE
jgi:hypothetical protein